jgi:hypothetical protein
MSLVSSLEFESTTTIWLAQLTLSMHDPMFLASLNVGIKTDTMRSFYIYRYDLLYFILRRSVFYLMGRIPGDYDPVPTVTPGPMNA